MTAVAATGAPVTVSFLHPQLPPHSTYVSSALAFMHP